MPHDNEERLRLKTRPASTEKATFIFGVDYEIRTLKLLENKIETRYRTGSLIGK